MTDHNSYSPDRFGLPWPKFAITSEQPADMPYEKPTDRRDDHAFIPLLIERCTSHIMCHKGDYSRLATLVTIVKAKKMWLKKLGKCYSTETPDHTF